MQPYHAPSISHQRVAGSAYDIGLKVLETITSKGFRKGAAVTAALAALGLAALAADTHKKVSGYLSLPMSSIDQAVRLGPYDASVFTEKYSK